jgi:hypothetical protein
MIMTLAALFLVWLSGFMAMAAVMHLSDEEKSTGFTYALLAVGFLIPAVVEMLP